MNQSMQNMREISQKMELAVQVEQGTDIAIRVKNIGKCYHIYDKPQDRLKQALRWGRKKLFREFWALQDVSFEVRKGETVGIIGRNGSGKSTLLQLICGTLAPTTGAVEFKGRVAALLELGAGFNPEFTGRENILMNASILGLSRQEIESKYDDIVAFADIGDFINQPVKTYSSGMTMRLAFAIIAHVNADILIIDEALAVGDAFFTQKCMRFLRSFRERGTILFVSHDSGAVINLCHRAIWLDHGKVKMLGTAKEACEAYWAALFEARQGRSEVSKKTSEKKIEKDHFLPSRFEKGPWKDQRLGFINETKYRNDIEVFAFNLNAPAFGKGGAKIKAVMLLDSNNEPLLWIVGGEIVTLIVQAEALQSIEQVIIGFLVKDRLGQTLFGDNTYLTYSMSSKDIKMGETIEARFQFQMPILPVGDYSMTVSIAEGTQASHVQHHWGHDALVFKSHSSSVCTGLIGIPMLDIQLR